MSPDSARSVWVDKEIKSAELYHKTIVPILLRGKTELSSLAGTQRIDAHNRDLPIGEVEALRQMVWPEARLKRLSRGAVRQALALSRRARPKRPRPRLRIRGWQVAVLVVLLAAVYLAGYYTPAVGPGVIPECIVVCPRQPPLDSTIPGHTGAVTSIAFSPGGQYLVTTGDDSITRLWSVSDPTEPISVAGIASHSQSLPVTSATFSPDGRFLAVSEGDQVIVRSAATPAHPSLLATLDDPGHRMWTVAFSPDSQILAVAESGGVTGLWDLHTPDRPVALATIHAPTDATAFSLAFQPTDGVLAVGYGDHSVRLWSLADPRAPAQLSALTGRGSGTETQTVAFSPDGRLLATAASDALATLYDVANPAQPTIVTTLGADTKATVGVLFTPDGGTLVTAASDGTTDAWNISAPQHPRDGLSIHDKHGAVCLAVSPDGHALVTGNTDGTAKLWRLS
jgi:WD40 repeat protein